VTVTDPSDEHKTRKRDTQANERNPTVTAKRSLPTVPTTSTTVLSAQSGVF